MKRPAWIGGILLMSCTLLGAKSSTPTRLSIDRLVAARQAVEAVYWHHRVWPEVNKGPKPPLAAIVDDGALRAMVTDGLRKSAALATLWKRPITPEQLQAEMDRMAAGTKSPQVLRELFSALGNDPTLVAETLARPLLADRLIREAYGKDPRLHADTRRNAEQAVGRSSDMDAMARFGGRLSEATYVRTSEGPAEAPQGSHDANEIALDEDAWGRLIDSLAATFGDEKASGHGIARLPVGRISGLQEDSSQLYVSLIRAATDDKIEIRTVTWRKHSFDEWWKDVRETYPATPEAPRIAYRLPPVDSTSCQDDTWTEIHRALPYPRWDHAVVWTGSEMIVWGGNTASSVSDTGDRYNPATDTWSRVRSDATAPTARYDPLAVWTGSEMIIWGGRNGGNTGGRYNPATDTWTPTRADGTTPVPRWQATAVWTGNTMIVWGGQADGGATTYLNSGGRYRADTDTWLPTRSDISAPPPRADHTAVWTGSRMIIWGGDTGNTTFSYLNTGGVYDPLTDTWVATRLDATTPAARSRHGAVWTGSLMVVWGGSAKVSVTPPVMTFYTSGGLYDPVNNEWAPTSSTNPPQGRDFPVMAWTGTEVIIWGGSFQSGNGLRTGKRYDPANDFWSTMADYPAAFGAPPQKGVWTGSEMIAWGGQKPVFGAGGRYSPYSDTWIPTTTDDTPVGRGSHTSVWTGSEMIIWGGNGGTSFIRNDGWRYDPATDAWTPTRLDATTPSPRYIHTAIWTGTEMIVWGGSDADNSGGRYSPATDTWIPTSIDSGTPSARYFHTAVWTGTRMIVWGGLGFNTGGLYDPSNDTWTPTRADATAPAGRTHHSAVWTGNQMIIFGGEVSTSPLTLLNSGGRYDPATDTWTPTRPDDSTPAGRSRHAAVWTGTHMIVWGGLVSPNNFTLGNTGAILDAQSEAWSPMSVPAFLTPRHEHSAVWTGKEMIVWGGESSNPISVLSTGGRYDPVHDSWLLTRNDATTPAARNSHTAAWTGTNMIVWGGGFGVDTGAAYCASTCSCDDGNDCTADTCDATGACLHAPIILPEPQPLMFTTDSEFEWPAMPGGAHWNTYRGTIPSGMLGGRLPGAVYDQACFESADEWGDGPTISLDSAVPPLGTAFYYLVTSEVLCEGPLGQASSGVEIPNFAPCPSPP